MRIKTADALRQVDRWKQTVLDRYRRFVASLSFLLISVGHRRQVLIPMFFTVGMSLHFALLELASLIVLGVFLLKLHSYRLANLLLRVAAMRAG